MSRRSSAITSRPDSGRSCPDRRDLCEHAACTATFVLAATRPLSAGRRRGHELPRFARLVVRSAGRHGRSLIAHRACGMWVQRMGVEPHWDGQACRRIPKHEFTQLTLDVYRTTGGRARPGPAVGRPPGGLRGLLERAFPLRRTRVPNRDWAYTRVKVALLVFKWRNWENRSSDHTLFTPIEPERLPVGNQLNLEFGRGSMSPF